MYAKYVKQEIADLNGTGQTQACYRMLVTQMSTKEFIEKCVSENGERRNLIMSALTLLNEKLALYMAEGRSVKLDGIGTFRAKLSVRKDKLPDSFEKGETKRNTQSIEVAGVVFKPDDDLVRRIRKFCHLKRDGERRLKRSKYTLEERIEIAKKYLKENLTMHAGDYARITGLSKSTATRELRQLAMNPASGITSRGVRSQKDYILRK
jgi:predicted histone-like DNA-binding protein